MPNRILKESITTSCEVDNLTAEEERLFYRLIVVCDDFGRMDGRLPIIRAKCFPLKLDKIKDKDVSGWLQGLARHELITLYDVGGKPYIQMSTWSKHQQKRAQHSKFPSPDDGVISNDITCKQQKSKFTEKRETRNEKRETELFEIFYKAYPRHKEKQAAHTKWQTCIKEDKPEDIITAAKNYAAECQTKRTEEKFVKLAKTFLGPDKHYKEYISMQKPEEQLLAPYHQKRRPENDTS